MVCAPICLAIQGGPNQGEQKSMNGKATIASSASGRRMPLRLRSPRGSKIAQGSGREGIRARALQGVTFLILIMSLSLRPNRAIAGGTQYWQLQGQEAYLRGDPDGISISREGRLMLAPELVPVFDTGQAFIWSSVVDRQGNIYVGTGHEGKVFRVDPQGRGTLVLDTEELDVTALAVDAEDNVYVGTSPQGKVYRLTPEGRSSVFFDPDDTYIWSLAVHEGALFVGTGAKGRVYRVDRTGRGQVLADTKETNIMALLVEPAGTLIAGTDPSGLILRITPQGKVFALYDSPVREIHDLWLASDGTIYALGLNPREARSTTVPPPSPSSVTAVSSTGSVTVTITSLDLTPPIASTGPEGQNVSAMLYRLRPSGDVETLWSAPSFSAFCLTLDDSGQVLLGTNDKGRIYAIDPRGNATLLVQTSEAQISRFVRSRTSLFVATSNLGKLFRLGPAWVTHGTYESPVFDARFIAQWGVVTWQNQVGQVEVRTRTGNTETPDETWSEWSPPVSNGGRVLSPPARFIQFRLTLTADRETSGSSMKAGLRPQIEGLRIAYLPQNVRPTIASLEVLPQGIALQEVPQQPVDPGILSSGLDPALFGVSMTVPPRRVYQRGARSFQWAANDPNGDQLVYSLFYRNVTERQWRPLVRDLTQTFYTLDTETLPDGWYVFRLVASDLPSNPPERALESERFTDPILIDNTPPVIRAAAPRFAGRRVEVAFVATDATSNIARAEVSVDGGRWQQLLPDDGIADSLEETFTVRIELEASGEHTITVRAFDMQGNVGSHKVTVVLP